MRQSFAAGVSSVRKLCSGQIGGSTRWIDPLINLAQFTRRSTVTSFGSCTYHCQTNGFHTESRSAHSQHNRLCSLASERPHHTGGRTPCSDCLGKREEPWALAKLIDNSCFFFFFSTFSKNPGRSRTHVFHLMKYSFIFLFMYFICPSSFFFALFVCCRVSYVCCIGNRSLHLRDRGPGHAFRPGAVSTELR